MTIGRPREFDTEEALERALDLFWRQGYEGTSLSDLTRALGITRASLYAAFGNKESLFRLVLDRYEAKAGRYRVDALEAPTAREYARQLLDGVVRLHGDKNNPPGCLGVQGALACGDEALPIRHGRRARDPSTPQACQSRGRPSGRLQPRRPGALSLGRDPRDRRIVGGGSKPQGAPGRG